MNLSVAGLCYFLINTEVSIQRLPDPNPFSLVCH